MAAGRGRVSGLRCQTHGAVEIEGGDPVVIDEAIEIAKKFGTKDSGRFVNGVLDGFVKRRAAAG